MSETSQVECRRNSWLVALAGGVLVALMLIMVAHYGILKALFIGLIFFVALGAFFVWAFCSRTEEPAHEAVAAPPPPAEPAPRPAAPAASAAPAAVARAPEPVAAPAPAPVAEPAKVASATPAVAAPKSPVKPRASKAAAKPAAKSAARPAAKSAPRKPAEKKPAAAKAKGATAQGLDAALAKSKGEPKAGEPEMLAAPRGGKADDLKMIKGVGPKLEKLLNEVGVWHFGQIASWKAKDIAFVDEKMVGFHGRITRDEWVKQAKVLAEGGKTEFAARVAKGDVY